MSGFLLVEKDTRCPRKRGNSNSTSTAGLEKGREGAFPAWAEDGKLHRIDAGIETARAAFVSVGHRPARALIRAGVCQFRPFAFHELGPHRLTQNIGVFLGQKLASLFGYVMPQVSAI